MNNIKKKKENTFYFDNDKVYFCDRSAEVEIKLVNISRITQNQTLLVTQ